jgi:hypothetical protein
MEDLLEQLIQQWENVFDEFQRIPDYAQQVTNTRYANTWQYDLEKFNWKSFPAGGKMTDNKLSIDASMLFEYGLNDDGRPVYIKYSHEYNKLYWEGIYRYNSDSVEMIEFCMNTKVPASYEKISFENGRKVLHQKLKVNGGASNPTFNSMSRDEIISNIRSNKYHLILDVTRFDYGDTRIEKSHTVQMLPGLGIVTAENIYSYDEDGMLGSIKSTNQEGEQHLSYVRNKKKKSASKIIDELANAMATAIIDTLVALDIKQPLQLLELAYHDLDNYCPLLAYQTVEDVKQALADGKDVLLSNSYTGPMLDVTPFEELCTLFEQQTREQIDENEDFSLGARMLNKVAVILNKNKLGGKLDLAEDFGVYAVDWSMADFDDVKKILLDCGIKKAVINTWEKKGFFLLS